MIKNKLLISAGICLIVIILFLNIASSLSATTDVEFGTTSTNPYCYIPDDQAAEKVGWIENNKFISWDDADYNCFRESGKGPNGMEMKECCPAEDSECNINSDTKIGKCEKAETSCSQYKTQDKCNEGHVSVATPELEGIAECNFNEKYGTLCDKITTCRCKWDGESCLPETATSICETTNPLTCHNSDEANNNCFSSGTPIIGECLFDIKVTDNCNISGKMLRAWTIKWEGTKTIEGSDLKPGYCTDGSDSISCFASRLDFFSITSIIVFIILIIVFYLIILRKRRHKDKKKRTRKN